MCWFYVAAMASNETVLVENAVSKQYYLQLISIGISTFLNERFQLEQFHLKPSGLVRLRANFFKQITFAIK